MAIKQLLSALDAHLTDELVMAAVHQFLTSGGYQIEYDAETIVLSPSVKVHILDKSLVLDRDNRDGAYLTARAVLDPIFRDGEYTGVSRGGTLKIIFDLAGEYTDDVYSRANVVATE